MTPKHSSRIFASSDATTLYVTIPAEIMSDSQFSFDADDIVSVAIDGDRLVVTGTDEETE